MRNENVWEPLWIWKGSSVSCSQLFQNFDVKKIKKTSSYDFVAAGINNRKVLSSRLFTYAMYLIMLDLTINNTIFVLPLLGNTEGVFYVKKYYGKAFNRMFAKKKFKGIDPFKSNFNGYELTYKYKFKNFYREKPIYVNRWMKRMLYDNVNNGIEY